MPQSKERKREYMREYMRRKRSLSLPSPSKLRHRAVSPTERESVRPLMGRNLTKSQERLLRYFGIDPMDLRYSDRVVLFRDGYAVDPTTGQIIKERQAPYDAKGVDITTDIVRPARTPSGVGVLPVAAHIDR